VTSRHHPCPSCCPYERAPSGIRQLNSVGAHRCPHRVGSTRKRWERGSRLHSPNQLFGCPCARSLLILAHVFPEWEVAARCHTTAELWADSHLTVAIPSQSPAHHSHHLSETAPSVLSRKADMFPSIIGTSLCLTSDRSCCSSGSPAFFVLVA
jgi:hypothetical protein